MNNYQKLLKFYITGFILSLLLTLGAYYPVLLHVQSKHKFIDHFLIFTGILLLAFLQLLVQLFFFLHLGEETKPRWKLAMFISFAGIILIVILASVWIMQHLNYNMSLIRLNAVMQHGEGF